MTEVFHRSEGVEVNASSFECHGQSFGVSDIRLVRAVTEKPTLVTPLLCGGIGLVAMLFGGLVPGLALIGVAVFLWYFRKERHAVEVDVGSGVKRVLVCQDVALANEIVTAIKTAKAA